MKSRLALLLLACTTACAESPPVVNNLGSVTPSQVSTATPPAALANDYQMMKRLEQMQAELQKLTGKVEEQTYHIEELKKQQKTMYTDFDDRIQNLENKSSSAPTANSSPADTSGTASPEPSTTEPALTPPPIAVPPTSSTPAAPVVPAQATKPPALPPQTEPVPPPAPEAMPLSAAEKQEYQAAYDNLRNGRTAQAISQFNAFISNHPSSTYAGNAQYWLGEAHRVNMDNNSARQAFNTVIDKFPASAKVSDALLKLGYIEVEEKNPTKAREILTRVTTEYPNTRAAAIAEKKLATIH